MRTFVATASFTLTPAGADIDIFQLIQANNARFRLMGFVLGQTSDLGNGAEEMMELRLVHITGSTGINVGTTIPAEAVDDADSYNSATVKRGGTMTGNGAVTTRTLERFTWNVRSSPLQRWYLDKVRRIVLPIRPDGLGAAGLALRRESSIVDDLDCVLTVHVGIE